MLKTFHIATKFQREAEKKAAVPKKDEKPIMGLVSDKNFIVANAVENILAGKLFREKQTLINVNMTCKNMFWILLINFFVN